MHGELWFTAICLSLILDFSTLCLKGNLQEYIGDKAWNKKSHYVRFLLPNILLYKLFAEIHVIEIRSKNSNSHKGISTLMFPLWGAF